MIKIILIMKEQRQSEYYCLIVSVVYSVSDCACVIKRDSVPCWIAMLERSFSCFHPLYISRSIFFLYLWRTSLT